MLAYAYTSRGELAASEKMLGSGESDPSVLRGAALRLRGFG
jgi:hypothetical protein